jgi:hypothetical protein
MKKIILLLGLSLDSPFDFGSGDGLFTIGDGKLF